jgi:murein DD-endopeptidase MepM/ murein hydrolase activator NlpD
MRADKTLAVLVGALALVVGTGPRAEEPGTSDERGAREAASLAARADVVRAQGATARTAARWRVRELYRLVVAERELGGLARARAVELGARAVAREVAELRALEAEAARAAGERDAVAAAAAGAPDVGARPRLAPPVAGAALARFGTSPDPATGVLVSRAGVRLAARAGERVRAPGAGTVARVAADPAGGLAVVLDHGAGWTTIVAGLAEAGVVEGAVVAPGAPLGAAARPVTFEVWRGPRPVDPLLPTLLAAPPALN